MFELELLTAAALGVTALALGLALGWRFHAKMRDAGLEVRAQVAEIENLQAALADSQKRCARQTEWLKSLEPELTLAKGDEEATKAPQFERNLLIQ